MVACPKGSEFLAFHDDRHAACYEKVNVIVFATFGDQRVTRLEFDKFTGGCDRFGDLRVAAVKLPL